jgi:hypothetical protein
MSLSNSKVQCTRNVDLTLCVDDEPAAVLAPMMTVKWACANIRMHTVYALASSVPTTYAYGLLACLTSLGQVLLQLMYSFLFILCCAHNFLRK